MDMGMGMDFFFYGYHMMGWDSMVRYGVEMECWWSGMK